MGNTIFNFEPEEIYWRDFNPSVIYLIAFKPVGKPSIYIIEVIGYRVKTKNNFFPNDEQMRKEILLNYCQHHVDTFTSEYINCTNLLLSPFNHSSTFFQDTLAESFLLRKNKNENLLRKFFLLIEIFILKNVKIQFPSIQ